MQTRWVSVSVQLAPSGAVTQVTVGLPGQEDTTVPRDAVGVRTTGWLISTLCVPAFPIQLAEGTDVLAHSFLPQ